MFLQGLHSDISQALPWPNHVLGTPETGSVVTLGQKQPVWPLGRMWKKWSEAKGRVGAEETQPLSLGPSGRAECEARESSPREAPKGEPPMAE